MYHRKENELYPTDWSETSDKSIVMAPDADASSAFLDQKLSTQKINVMERGDEAPHNRCLQDSRIRFCRYCDREFKSDKALNGHLRIHSQKHQAKSKAGIHHIKSTKLTGKHSPEEEEDGFNCFVCADSFSSMKLLCQHMRDHHDKDSNGIQQPVPSQESNSLNELETTVKEGIDIVSPRNDLNQESRHIDFLKDMLNWSQTGKGGLKKTADNIIYNAVPLRSVNYGSAVPQMKRRLEDSHDSKPSLPTRKKQRTEETMPYQDTSMESELGAADSDSRVSMMRETHISNKSKSSSSHGRKLKNPKRAKVVKSVHQCEICGKTFETGQALGGHKTCHRVKSVVPFKFELAQGKTKQQLCGESGQVREYITKMLLPGALSEEADVPEESHQEHPKKMRDFDLNIPYEG